MFINKPLLTMLCIAAGITMIAACKKDTKPSQQSNTRLLLRVASAANNKVDKFVYNAQGQVVRSYYYNGYGVDTAYQDYTYKNNLLHKVVHYNAEFSEFFYSGDTLKKMEVNDSRNGVTNYVEYTYKNGRPDAETGYHRENGQWVLAKKKTFRYDIDGNVQRINLFTGKDLALQETIEFSNYSGRPDPLLAIIQQKYQKGGAAMPRLAGKEVHLDGGGFEEWTTEYTYEYDIKGYPVKREAVSRNPDNNIIGRTTVFYSYSN